MKLRGALLTVVAATVCALSGLVSPRDAAASIDFVNQWPATPTIVSNSNAGTVTGKFTPGMGTNRLMLVAVATEYSAAIAPTITASYGGGTPIALTQILNNTTGNNKIWLGYMNEANLASASAAGTKLTVTATTTNLTAIYATVAVFNGVDQAAPFNGTNFGSLGTTVTATTNGPVAVTKTSNAGLAGNNGLCVYLVNWNNNVGQTTVSSGFTEAREYVGANFSLSGSYKVTTGVAAESLTSTTTTTAISALAAVALNPAVRLATISAGACGDCHGNPPVDGTSRNVPPGGFQGSHEKHAGDGDVGYSLACTVCHRNNTLITHANGRIKVAGSSLANTAYSLTSSINTNSRGGASVTLGTCSTVTCHSTGRGPGMGTVQYTAPTWGATTTCLSCHAGRAGTGNGAQANSTSGFKLSTTHSQHLKYPAANINCNICHSKTASFNGTTLTLKQYTGVIRHANNVSDVTFGDVNYGSYTSYKTSGVNAGKCTNLSCHGGITRAVWSPTVTNNNHTCTHCHGQPTGVATNNSNLKMYAPGWISTGTGTSTDGNTASTDLRVGAHFVHLSSVFMKPIKCNECHIVPSNPFDGTHMTGPRYNSQTVTFVQASSANKNSVSPVVVPGTAVAASTCTTTYCHGSSLKGGDTAGTARSPQWNQDLTSNTPSTTVCGRCHGAPPNSVPGSHGTATLTGVNACSTCHGTVVNSTGVIINKTLHMNGIVEGGCTSCHAFPPTSNAHTVHITNIQTEKGLIALPGGFVDNAVCGVCHNTSALTKHAGDPTSDATSRNIFLPSVFGMQTSYSFGSTAQSYGKGSTTTCSNISCHLGTSTAWGDPPSACGGCHGYPPVTTVADPDNKHVSGATAVNHIGVGATVNTKATFVSEHGGCQICHGTMDNGSGAHNVFITYTVATQHNTGNINMNGPTGTGVGYNSTNRGCDNACHSNDATHRMTTSAKTLYFDYYGNAGTCITCHSTVKGSRAAVTGEFGLAWGHKKSGRGAVAVADCIVCHLEGNFSTQSTSTFHNNGSIDLRDPDGVGEVPIKDFSAANYAFTRYSVSYVAGSRTTSGTANTVANIVTVKFCIACHDANGATNTTARSSNGGTGTATMPFGGINLGANYTVANGAAVAGGLVNVATQFLSTNSSRHPVGAPNSRAYPYSTKLAAPYNNIGTTRNSNTLAGNTASPRVKADSVVLFCDDCHTTTARPTRRQITSHGNAASLFGTYYATTPTLCTYCHIGTYNDTTNGRHNTGSAFSVGTTRAAAAMNNCEACHFSKISAATATRPIKASDIHGFNTMLGTAGGWTYGAANGMRPIAFLRNNASFTATSPRPYTATLAGPGQFNLAAGQSTCGGSGNIVFCNGNDAHTNYSPGGSY